MGLKIYSRAKVSRGLFYHRERLRKRLAKQLEPNCDYFIVDSMPLEVCKLSRSSRRNGICKKDYAKLSKISFL